MRLLCSIFGLSLSLTAPEYTGGSGKCMTAYPVSGILSIEGCGKNPSLGFIPESGDLTIDVLLNEAACYVSDGIEPTEISDQSAKTLSDICPNFLKEGNNLSCCPAEQIETLNTKFNEMFSNLFQECPSCLRSQMEYYCNIYCSPMQSEFMEVEEVFEVNINQNPYNMGVEIFDVKLSVAYVDSIYDACKSVKQVWFDAVPPEFESLSNIPKFSTTIVSDRFCREQSNCDGDLWLNTQGMANGSWPRMGSLNTVTVDNTADISPFVHSCSESQLVFPNEDGSSKECGCFNCAKDCPPIDEIYIDMESEEFRAENPIDRSPRKCLYYPSCGKNLLLPNGEGQGRTDVPCFSKESRDPYNYVDGEDSAYLALLKTVCPKYFHNSPDGKSTETCCNFDQLSALSTETVQIRQLFGRCPSCSTNIFDVFCHNTCGSSQTEFMDPVDGFQTIDDDGEPAIGMAAVNLYFDSEYLDAVWDSCKDVTFPQTNGKVIEGLMCDGKTGEDCTVEVWLNFAGSTSNGFAPYNLNYVKVNTDKNGTKSFENRWKPEHQAISQEQLDEIMPGITPMYFDSSACNEKYVDPNNGQSEGSCSCQDCEASCPLLPEYPNRDVEQTYIGSVTTWAFIGIMIASGIVFILVFSLVMRKVFKQETRGGENVTSVTAAYVDESAFNKIGQKTITEADVSALDKIGYKTQKALQHAFEWWAKNIVCKFPLITLAISAIWTGTLIAGFKDIEFTTDPIVLWAAESSRSFQEYEKFNNFFVPFYRASQVIATLKTPYQKNDTEYVTVDGESYMFNEILNSKYWEELFDLSMEIKNIKTSYINNDGEKTDITWDDVCFNPLSDPTDPKAGGCSLFSIFQYWQNDFDLINENWYYVDESNGNRLNTSYKDHLIYCTKAPSSLHNRYLVNEELGVNVGLPCGSDFGSPIFPFLAIGGYNASLNEYWTGEAIIMNFINNNMVDTKSDEFKAVYAFEGAFINIMHKAAAELDFFDVAYFAERSIEDEIDATTESDLIIFIISYALIFLYITVALGKYTSLKRIPVDMKVSLATGGIIIILASALAATGVFGWARVASNLIVMEVVPFLILAVGADNVFILVMDIQREERKHSDTTTDVISRVLGRGGPSMLLCASTEATVFFIGSLSGMPAVKVFAINAGLAIIFNFLLQITAFLALVKLDMDRQEANRWDLFICIKSKTEEVKIKAISVIDIFFRDYYTPFLMNDLVGFLVICCFSVLLGGSIYAISIATVGLDQNLSVPKSSYVAKYFDYMETYFMVGVPVYFVLEGKFKYENAEYRNLVCGSAGCDILSLAEQISRASLQPKKSKIETPATIWADDYIDWIKPFSGCCRTFNCDNNENEEKCDFCAADESSSIIGETRCNNCMSRFNWDTIEGEDGLSSIANVTTNTEVSPEDFKLFLDYFLTDNPNEYCSKGGHASYGDALDYTMKPNDNEYDSITATYYMAYHSVCIESVECQENLEMARYLADNITDRIQSQMYDLNKTEDDPDYIDPESISVWPYSIYYPYYEQYINLAEEAMIQIAVCLIPVFLFTFVLLGFDFASGLIVVLVVTMIIVDTYGMCALWGVDFNALTLINLIAAIGISVEFTAHTTRSFALNTKPDRKARVIDTMTVMGPAVMMGVAFTNLPGIICLHWAQAQIIEIFFFRMCFINTLMGIAHGLIFLPVILAYFGPNPNRAFLLEKQKELVQKVRAKTSPNGSKKYTKEDKLEETHL